jgi:hypothetical protein
VRQTHRFIRVYDCFAAERRLRQLLQIALWLTGISRTGARLISALR